MDGLELMFGFLMMPCPSDDDVNIWIFMVDLDMLSSGSRLWCYSTLMLVIWSFQWGMEDSSTVFIISCAGYAAIIIRFEDCDSSFPFSRSDLYPALQICRILSSCKSVNVAASNLLSRSWTSYQILKGET